jgi:two-component system response regulator HydG
LRAKILIADDEPEVCELVEIALARLGHEVTIVKTGEEALERLAATEYDVLLSDYSMGGMTGVELCRKAVGLRPELCVIILTAFGSMELAVDALRAGAWDFVTKPVSLEVLTLTLKRAVERQTVGKDLRRLATTEVPSSLGMVGSSPGLAAVVDLVRRVAVSDATVLIQGETGTGKELVARAIHQVSGRKGPFVAINCSALPEGLLESELFGHLPGAFTDARGTRAGLFVEATGGTVFLDEIGEMPLGMQSKLLRALQEKAVRPLGGSREVPFDARIVTATNKNLGEEVAAKRFRADLHYRVNVVTIEVPPLRARPEDILPLSRHFLAGLKKKDGAPLRLGRAVAARLVTYPWPGNIRELENCIERAVAFARFDEITLDDLPVGMRSAPNALEYKSVGDESDSAPMELVEQNYIRKVMEAVNGDKTAAARILGFDRRTLYRKLAVPDEDADAAVDPGTV